MRNSRRHRRQNRHKPINEINVTPDDYTLPQTPAVNMLIYSITSIITKTKPVMRSACLSMPIIIPVR